jgi:hypothetical protein
MFRLGTTTNRSVGALRGTTTRPKRIATAPLEAPRNGKKVVRAKTNRCATALIGGMHGAKWYAKLSDRFEMGRPT